RQERDLRARIARAGSRLDVAFGQVTGSGRPGGADFAGCTGTPTRDGSFEKALFTAADSFVVRGIRVARADPGGSNDPAGGGPVVAGGVEPRETSVLAGYPWFEEWGRDAFIALPGLCLVTGRFDEARGVIRRFCACLRDGLIPNRIPAPGRDADYRSADASLWFVYALWKYLEYTADLDLLSETVDAVMQIVEAYARGTRFGIHSTPNGMLWQGDDVAPLTWMDAMVDGRAVTPRVGWAVEMNGLWYNALHVAARLTRVLGGRYADAAERYLSAAARMRKSFEWLMWDAERGVAIDVRGPDGPDPGLRPNQVICMFLPFPLLTGDKAASALRAIMEELYTPFGMRTLSPRDDQYVGRYRGGPAERDSAYHQGTAWPWLTGPLVTAIRRADGYAEASRSLAGRLLEPFKRHLCDAGLGTISELFDGDPPHEPGGCVSQAWSVGEILRAYVEDYLEIGPEHAGLEGISG
ncbi:MAG: hypothetical protein NUV93_06750, partial [Firmicutes bacterium]|nr:hypothetical protein [Bacillota bacterium]